MYYVRDTIAVKIFLASYISLPEKSRWPRFEVMSCQSDGTRNIAHCIKCWSTLQSTDMYAQSPHLMWARCKSEEVELCPDIKIAVMFKCDLRTPTFPKWVIGEGGRGTCPCISGSYTAMQLHALPTSLINLNLKSKGIVIKLVCWGEGGERNQK